MKNFRSALLAAALSLVVAAGSATAAQATTKIRVGASPTPHAEILKVANDVLKPQGYELQIIEYSDYVQPNMALEGKELDANFFQHVPYLEKFISEHKMDLVSAGKVHVEPMGVYSKTITDKNLEANLPNGSKVAIPNDPSNGGRALILLQKAGLITLKDPNNIYATKADIASNPKNLEFVELEAAQLPRSLDDVAIAVINTNYALEAGLDPLKGALYLEDKDSPYANIVAVRKGDENRPEIQKLMKALQSPEVKKFIEDKYKGAILPAF